MPLLNQTTTVQEIMDWCAWHTGLQNYFRVGGSNNEPAMTICNSLQQALLARPMTWKFNRKVLDSTNGAFLVTTYGVQDYRHAGATAFVLQSGAGSNGAGPSGGVGVDMTYSPVRGGVAGISVASGVATVQTIDPHPFQPGQTVFLSGVMDSVFQSVFTFNPVTRTSAWTAGFTILTVPDQFHFTFTAPSNTQATITNIAIANNVITATAANGFKVGQVVTFTGVGTNTFLNAQQATIVTASGSSFTAVFSHADVVSGADTGTVTVCSGAPGFGTSDPQGNPIGLPAWSWGESASLVNINSTAFPQPVTPDVEFVRELTPAYGSSGNKPQICMFADEQNGVLRFRLSEPGGSYCVQFNVVYQARAPKLTTPQSVFAWPDDVRYVLNEAALFYAFRFAKGISANESQSQFKFMQGAVGSAMAGEDRESNAQGLVPERSLMRG
jgi:hypothetical protein